MKRLLLIASALALAGSTGLHANAQTENLPTFMDSIFVFYADSHVADSDVEAALDPALRLIPTILVYDVPSADLTYVLRHLSDMGAISLDEPSLQKAPDTGDFILTYEPNPNSEYEPTARQWLLDNGLLEREVGWLNENFRLPYDVDVVAEECGVVNAFYDLISKEVIICYEYVDHVWSIGDTIYDDQSLVYEFTEAVVIMVLYHEVGHAILDVYDLPYTGLEENVADQFSSLILSYTYDDETGHDLGQDMLYYVGDYYLHLSEQDGSHPYWTQHGTDMQRFYNISCYAYGADPTYNQDLIADGWLPEDRTVWCEDEYQTMESAFEHLLWYHTNGFFD